MWDIVGKAVAVYLLARFLACLWFFCRCFVFPAKNLKSFGEWAVVTGSTDGIGKEYARELARKGLKLILISRSQDKLDAVKSDIGSEHKTEIKTIAFDYSADSGYEKIEKELSGHEIGILVNNVGVGYEYPEYFADYSIDAFQKMLNVNMLSAIKMTHMIIPQMLERKKGAIINISSASALGPTPLLTVYSATKAFIDFFSRALQIECRSKGIISQAVLPFFVATKMSGIKRTSTFAPGPRAYAQQALRTVGIVDRSHGFWSHEIQAIIMGFIPEWIGNYLAVKMLLSVRAKYLKKKQK